MRKRVSETLASFIPSIESESTAHMSQRLRRVYTTTLAAFEPVETGADQKAEKPLDSLEDQSWHENLALPELSIPPTRAGLYIYLNAAVSGWRLSVGRLGLEK